MTEAYLNEAVELDRYKAEMEKLRARRKGLERTVNDIDRRAKQQVESTAAMAQLETFCHRVSQGLEGMSFEDRQGLLRLVVERVVVDDGTIRIETLIPIEGEGASSLKGERGPLRPRHPERSRGVS